MYRTILLFLFCLSDMSVADEATSKNPVTEGEAREFCKEFEKRVIGSDTLWLNKHIDVAGMMWRATDNSMESFAKGFREGGLAPKDGLPVPIAGLISKKELWTDYRFRKVRFLDKEWKGLFRTILPDNKFNFHELTLVRKANGEVGASEFYNYAVGDTITDSYRELYLDELAFRKDNAEGEIARSAQKTLISMHEAMQKGYFGTAMKLYEKLPEHVKKSRFASILQVKAASNTDAKTFVAVVEQYAQKFPNDPSKDLFIIETPDLDQAIKALDRLIARTGGDGHLYFLKASLLNLDQKPKEAIEAAREGIVVEADYKNLYFAILSISLHNKDYIQTKEMLEVLESKFETAIGDLSMVPEYADFVKSPEYAEWKKAREKKSEKRNENSTGASP